MYPFIMNSIILKFPKDFVLFKIIPLLPREISMHHYILIQIMNNKNNKVKLEI